MTRKDMRRALVGAGAVGVVLAGLFGVATAAGQEDAVVIGEWRTEMGKALVCGGIAGDLAIEIARSANAFYLAGGKPDSAEYAAYWSLLEKALKEQKCFVTQRMRHKPDSIPYAGPEDLEASGKRFKILGTTIESEGKTYPAFTMTTLKVVNPDSRPGAR